MKYKINTLFNNYEIINFVIDTNKNYLINSKDNQADIIWYNKEEFRKFKKDFKYKFINNIYGLFTITNKMQLCLNYNKIKSIFASDFNFFPDTYRIPIDYQKLKNNYKRKKGNINFIIKPDNSSQGRGIKIINDYKKIELYKSVCQLYINEPFLIQKKKFDLRIYCFIKILNKKLYIYLYKEGLVRFSSEFYENPNIYNIKNNFIHLTNYSINSKNKNISYEQIGNFDLYKKYVENYEENIENEDGIKIDSNCIKYLFSTIFKNHFNKLQQKLIKRQIKDIIIKTCITMFPILKMNKEDNAFHLLGFDLLIDKKFKVWLLEVNKNPSLSCKTNIDFNLKYEWIVNILNNLLNINLNPNLNPKLSLLYEENLGENKINNIYKEIKKNNTSNLKIRTLTKINFNIKEKKNTQMNFFQNSVKNFKNKYEKFILGIQYKYDEFNGLIKENNKNKFNKNKNNQILIKKTYKYSNINNIYLNK